VLRLTFVGDHLPGLVSGDEQVMLARTVALNAGHLPTEYDWPSGPFLLLAPLLRMLPAGRVEPYLVARTLVALAGVALVILAGLVAASLSPPGLRRRVAAWIAGASTAVAYPAVSASRSAHPEILQDAAATAALLVTLRLATDPRRRWAVLAGALGGVAAGMKYVGGVVVLVTVVAALLPPTRTASAARSRAGRSSPGLRHAVAALAAAFAAFAVLVPATVTDPAALVAGLDLQFLHSANGHVGFDSTTPALVYHLTESLPGSLGWPAAVVILTGAVLAVVQGGRRARLVALFVALAGLPIGLSHLTFPRYLLLVLPALCCLAAAELARLAVTRRAAAALGAMVTLALVPATLDAVRLVRAEGAQDTRVQATSRIATLPGPVYVENFTVLLGATTADGPAQFITGLDRRPDLGPGCACYVVVSSFMQDRYRDEPDRYGAQVARYAELARTADLVVALVPSTRFDYRWEALPQYGIRSVPLTGPLLVGPTVTIYHWS